MKMGCGDCGCVVEHGVRLKVCDDQPCCFAELPKADNRPDEVSVDDGA